MHELEFLIYHLSPPYGITELPQNLGPDTGNKRTGDSPDSTKYNQVVAQNSDPAKFVRAGVKADTANDI